jgi:hypothetical protein
MAVDVRQGEPTPRLRRAGGAVADDGMASIALLGRELDEESLTTVVGTPSSSGLPR